MKKVWILFLSLFCISGFSFPETVRWGYSSCTLCHFNPNGGGLINTFGRAISAQNLSTWSQPGEQDFLYGAIPSSKLFFGGDQRVVQVYKDSPYLTQARFILMQADLEAAVQAGKWVALATLGGQSAPKAQVLSRRHFVSYQPKQEWHFQAGRFKPAFGINTPDHFIATKRGLGWDEGAETAEIYGLQAAYLPSSYDVFLNIHLGRFDEPLLEADQGVSVRARYYLPLSRLGFSYYLGSSRQGSRHVFGPSLELGFSSKTFLLLEIDMQKRFPSPSAWGLVNYLKLDHEWFQGFHTYLMQDFARLDLSDPNSVSYSFGLGVQFFPRPHLEINSAWQKQKQLLISNTFQDFAWLMLHYYL